MQVEDAGQKGWCIKWLAKVVMKHILDSRGVYFTKNPKFPPPFPHFEILPKKIEILPKKSALKTSKNIIKKIK